jgi:mannose-6-phosphate isomerase-like protein (cupin superfamily)
VTLLKKVSPAEKFSLFSENWNPQIVGEVNDFHVKFVRIDGEFVWHHHDVEDELFFIVDGEMDMHYRDERGAERVERVAAGEFLVVPHGVEHKPVSHGGAKLMLIEPKSTVNTGSAPGERTRDPAWI